MKILILGATGMLGFAIQRALHDAGWSVVGTLRAQTTPASRWCNGMHYTTQVDVQDRPSVLGAIERTGADVVVNAAGVIKQVAHVADHERLLSINAVFPQLLDADAKDRGFRVVHFSTDCVFNGNRGQYLESDRPDATDMYGMSKFLGESSSGRTLVLRTSIIGRGLAPNGSLVDWFLAQTGSVSGFRRAVFSGLPVNEIGSLLASRILPQLESLHGLYHLSAAPINKFDLIELVRLAWSRQDMRIEPNDTFTLDRSLDSERLRSQIGYMPPKWPDLVADMQAFYAALDAPASTSAS